MDLLLTCSFISYVTRSLILLLFFYLGALVILSYVGAYKFMGDSSLLNSGLWIKIN